MIQDDPDFLADLIGHLPGMAYRCRNEPGWPMEFVSNGSLALTGYQPAALLGDDRQTTYGALIHPQDQSLVWQAVQTGLQEQQPFQITYRLATPAGEKWVWERGRGVYADNGQVIALEGFITDISERVLAEQTLEQRIRQRTYEIERRRRVAEGLQDILETLNSNRPLPEILDTITCQAMQLLDTAAVAVYRLDQADNLLRIQAAQGLSADYVQQVELPLGQGALGRAVVERRPVVVADVRAAFATGESPAALDNKEIWLEARLRRLLTGLTDRYGAVAAAPLFVKEEIYGGLVLYYPTPREFAPEEIELAVTLANQAALAIENARLRTRVEQAAVLEERQRLARELHDSVSQALYGIGLGARTARTLLDRAAVSDDLQAKLVQALDYTLSLADAGLTEMRALIFALRPDALSEQGLAAALERQAQAFQTRRKAAVETDICPEPDLPPAVKEALYRVAQEALNNVAKHARAGRVWLRLQIEAEAVVLEVKDDGVGFEPQQDFPGHMGLQSMQERLEKLNGCLTISSAPGAGTVITGRVPAAISTG